LIRHQRFTINGLSSPCVYLALLSRYGASKVMGSRLLGSRDVISHVNIRLPGAEFLWVVHSDHASILHRYGDMAPQILDARTWTQKERWKNGKKKRKGEGKGREEKRKVEKKKEGKGKGEKKWKVKGRGRKMEKGRERKKGKGKGE